MKILIKCLKPRNRFVAAGFSRKAGAHRRSAGSRRGVAAAALRRELARLAEPGP